MLSYRSLKNGLMRCTLILLACTALFAQNATAQQPDNKKTKGAEAHIGTIQSLGGPIAYDAIITNMYLTAADPVYKVKSFSVTLIPKGQNLYGPFSATGDKFPEKVATKIKMLRGTPFNLVVEDIKMEKDGGEVAAQTMFFKCKG